MDCREAREHLADLHRGRLSPDLAEAVRAHAAECAACGEAVRVETALHALIRERAPRHAAPPALRARVQTILREAARPVSVGWRAWLRTHPWTLSAVAGAVAALVLVWIGGAWLTRDPVLRLVAQAVDEHVEYAREAMDRPVPDPGELLARLQSQALFPLGSVFPGDAEAPLVSAIPVKLRGKPAVALVYRNAPGRYTTLLLMPGADATIPAEDRLPIETFTPHHRVTSGKQVLYWKQRDLACLMVSDLDQQGLASMFLKVRKAA
jgi:anti-sigma factor (TIGR02949 family)